MTLFSILIFICIILLAVFLIVYWSNALYITFNQITSSQKKDIENYTSLLGKKEKKLKCGKRYSGHYSDLYVKNLRPWKDHEKELLKAIIRKIQNENVFFKNNEILKNCPNKKLEWNL